MTDTAEHEPGGGPRPPLDAAEALRTVAQAGARTAVLVEGWSDQAAVETLARRLGHDLAAMGVVVLPIGGVTNMRKFAALLGQGGLGLRLAGLYDASEEPLLLRAIGEVLTGSRLEPPAARRLGFFACHADLEDELLRALGLEGALQVIAAENEIAAFRRFQAQPAQRGRDLHAQVRRFLGTRAGRKIRYGFLLADALDLGRVPAPLAALLAHLSQASS